MSRNSWDPVKYSPATRRAIEALTSQLDWAEVHLRGRQAGLHRTLALEEIVTLIRTLAKLAETHRQWSDVDRLQARSAPYGRELSDTRLGIPPRTRLGIASRCDCMTEPDERGEERVLIHSLRCSLHPDYEETKV